MTTPQTRVERAGLAQLPGPAATTPPGGGGRGQAAGAEVPAAWPQTPGADAAGKTGAGPVGQGDGAGPALPPRVIGLDLSLSSTGVADSWNGISLYTVRGKEPHGDDVYQRRQRLSGIVRRVWDVVALHSVIPDLVVIEGPSYNSRDPYTWDRAGLWWRTIEHFIQMNIPVAIAPPATLKKYAAGKGNATKPDMRMALYQRAGIDERDDNKVDAWFLAAMGLDHLGHPPVKMPAAHREALGKVAWPEVPDGDR